MIFFAPPSGFNDPYDCAITPGIKRPTLKYAEHYCADSKNEFSVEVKKRLKQSTGKELQLILSRLARMISDQLIDRFRHNRGVACFSEINNELLMWAHYSKKYTGFCLEFNAKSKFFDLVRDVKYVEDIPILDIETLLNNTDTEEVLTKLSALSPNLGSMSVSGEFSMRKQTGRLCIKQRI